MAQLTHGMDIQQVRSSMSKIESLAGQIDSLRDQLNTAITNLLNIWSGPDANQYVNTTWPPYKSNMTQLTESLRQLATTGRTQATQQEQTSAS